jgi:hypothetical protein
VSADAEPAPRQEHTATKHQVAVAAFHKRPALSNDVLFRHATSDIALKITSRAGTPAPLAGEGSAKDSANTVG